MWLLPGRWTQTFPLSEAQAFMLPRQSILVAATSSRAFFVRLVQNLVELLQLPGLEDDRAFQKEIGLRTLVYKAYR